MKGLMNISERSVVEELVQKGESQTLRFKKSLSVQRQGLEALYTMVNSGLARGIVVFELSQNEMSSDTKHLVSFLDTHRLLEELQHGYFEVSD